jgi:hypothetical protein
VIPDFLKLPKILIELNPKLSPSEKKECITKWFKTNADLIITVFPHMIADRTLAEKLQPIREEFMQCRPYHQMHQVSQMTLGASDLIALVTRGPASLSLFSDPSGNAPTRATP